MFSRVLVGWLVLIGLVAGVACSPAAVQVPTGSIPISVAAGGIVTVQVAVGEADPVPLQVDTGSAGIRIFSDAVDVSVPSTAPTVSPTFGDGTAYTGQVTEADVKVGSISSQTKINIQVVDKVSCNQGAAGTTCSRSQDSVQRQQGMSGILGVATLPDDQYLTNPLPQLNQNFASYTISFDESGGGITPAVASSGTPSASPSTSTVFSLEAVQGSDGPKPPEHTSYWSSQVSACWAFAGGNAECTSTLFDSGTSAMVVPFTLPNSPVDSAKALRSRQGTVQFHGSQASNASLWQVSSGRNPSNTILTQDSTSQPAVIAGTPFWFDHSVTYDLTKGLLTVTPHG